MTVLVRAGVLTHLEKAARTCGLDARPLLREARLSRATLADIDARIPLQTAMDVLEKAARHPGCAAIGLLMAERRLLADLGAVGLLVQHQSSLRAAIGVLRRYEHLLNESLAIQLDEGPEVAVVREEVAGGRSGQSRQSIELAVGIMVRMCCEIAGAQWRPIEVHFMHAQPADVEPHRRLFRCRLVFDSDFNGVVLATADLDRDNPGADALMARYARRYLDTMPDNRGAAMEQRIRNALYLLLPLGRGALEPVAAHLGLTGRTLQRRLEASQIQFSKLLDEVRAELAERHLRNGGYALSQVAEMVGYASPSAFTRWFTAHFQVSPSAYRAGLR